MVSLKEKIKNREPVIGSWITLAHPAIAEIMVDAGFDWLAIDLEHSVITIREAEELIRIISLKGVSPLIRLTANDPRQIKRVMDAGAHGIIVPMICSADDAKNAVSAIKYPPMGTRGVGLARAQGYGFTFKEYMARINGDSIVIAQVEHVDAVRDLGRILEVDGVDGTLIGPYDLSASMGTPGVYDTEEFENVLKQYESTCSQKCVAKGFHVVPPDYSVVVEKIKSGYSFIALSTDFLFLGSMCRDQLKKIRSTIEC